MVVVSTCTYYMRVVSTYYYPLVEEAVLNSLVGVSFMTRGILRIADGGILVSSSCHNLLRFDIILSLPSALIYCGQISSLVFW